MFKIIKKSKISRARLGLIETKHGRIATPVFMPDATRGVVKNLSNQELNNLGLKCFVANTLHLFLRPGIKLIKKAGGLRDFVNWQHPILSDSGGYQVFSLIHKNKSSTFPGKVLDKSQANGKITDQGAIFRSPLNGSRLKLTPEQSIRIQFDLGVDMMVCLDDCPPNNYNDADLKIAVSRTIKWAKRCWLEYQKNVKCHLSPEALAKGEMSNVAPAALRPGRLALLARRAGLRGGRVKNYKRPLLFAVIQGGNNLALREHCAKELIKIGFDGFGFGARHIDDAGNFLAKTLAQTANMIPEDKLRFGLGIGLPEDIIRAIKMGWDMFDCVIPTREGRHGRLFLFNCHAGAKRSEAIASQDSIGLRQLADPSRMTVKNNFYETINITNAKFAKDFSPINGQSKLLELRTYSKGYLRYLFKINEPLAMRLASLNNLEFYIKMLSEIRGLIKKNMF